MTERFEATADRRNRLILRCVIEFMLDEGRHLVLTHERNFTRAAVHLAVLQASRRALHPGPRISLRSIAFSLGLPYETARRHVRTLETSGILLRLPRGGPPFAPGPQAQLRFAERRAALVALIGDLKALGVDFDLEPAVDRLVPDLDAAIADLLDDYTLRVLAAAAKPHGSMFDALIFVGLLSVNARPITYDPDLATRYAASDTPPPDDLRRPATVIELSARLGLPHETIRRHISHFRERGWVERVRAGFLASMARQQDLEVLQSGQIIVEHFIQLVRAVQRLGLDVSAIPPHVRGASAG